MAPPRKGQAMTPLAPGRLLLLLWGSLGKARHLCGPLKLQHRVHREAGITCRERGGFRLTHLTTIQETRKYLEPGLPLCPIHPVQRGAIGDIHCLWPLVGEVSNRITDHLNTCFFTSFCKSVFWCPWEMMLPLTKGGGGPERETKTDKQKGVKKRNDHWTG
jgi:hypothetical protein